MGQQYFVFKTSFAQERLWFLDQFSPGNPFYNIHVALPVGDDGDPGIVKRCLQEIVRRHEALRTTFVVLKGEPVQAVAPALDLDVPVVDLTGRSADECEAAIQKLSRDESLCRFDLASGPLLRAVLVRLAVAPSVLLLTMHHIISDGWSMDVFTRELRTLYDALAAGLPSPLPDLPIQYPDYAVWQREWLRGDVLQRQLAYWTKRLDGAPALLELPADRPRPPVQSYAGAYQSASISAATVDSLRRLAQREGATMFMALAAAFMTLLHRHAQQHDVVIGTPIANRTRHEVQDLIGFFVNTLVLRVSFADDPSFRALLRRVREVAVEAYQNQDLPFEKLVAELAPQRELSHSPIFQAMFVHQTSLGDRPVAAGPHAATGGADGVPGTVEHGTAKFDLTLFSAELDSGHVAVIVEYNTDLFDDARMTRLLGHFGMLVEGLVAQPDRPVGELPLLTPEERATLDRWSGSRSEYPRESTVHALFAARAVDRPDAVALVSGSHSITYGELLGRAGSLAHRLRDLGAGRNVPVAVCVDRSIDLVVSMLAVLGAGAAYVPLDPAYPTPRLAMMLEDTAAPLVVTTADTLQQLPPALDIRTVVLDDADERAQIAAHPSALPASEGSADDLAYIMYTSGSTGRPKGVAVPHRGIVRLVLDTNYVSLDASDTVLQFAPASFDASTFEIWGALLNGARLAIAPAGLLSTDELGAVVASHQVTTMWLTASVFQEVAEGDLRPHRSVRQLLAGGDVLPPAHVRRAMEQLPGCRIINGYGPTEGTTFTCCHHITAEDLQRPALPIGRAISNTTVRVLDRRLQPVPVGVPGELFIGGDGLARGYWRRDDLTAERFVRDPWGGADARLYRTGDVVRWREDGVLEFLGRRDHQVKVRGFRVELAEIEATLLQHPAVKAAAVVTRGEGSSKRLVAHIASGTADVGAGSLRRFVSSELPDYMVPSEYIVGSRLPMTPTGKIDREALAQSAGMPLSRDAEYAAPSSDAERTIVGIWQDVLAVDHVAADDNFFELGGHSLLMVRAQRLLQDALGVPLSLVELFQYPTVRSLADHVTTRNLGETGEDRAEERAARQRDGMRQQRAARAARREELT